LDTAVTLRLRDWTLYISHTPTVSDGEGHPDAEIEPTYGRKHAVLRFSEFFRAVKPELQRQAIAHELIHLHLRSLRDQIRRGLWDSRALGEQAYRLFFECYDEQMEIAVDSIADAVSEFLPMIEWPSEEER